MASSRLQFDEIGAWSQLKLEILRDYASAYSTILHKQPKLSHVYVEGFAGAGEHKLKKTGELVPGSQLNALAVRPRFKEVHLIELEPKRVDHLRDLTRGESGVHVYEGDCNRILLESVFPRIEWSDFKRGRCLLDPYGLHFDWRVLERAGRMRSIEVFLNFPIMDMNRNAMWSRPEKVDPADIARMNAFWGDDSWRNVAYRAERTLFGPVDAKRPGNEPIVHAFRKRLEKEGHFEFVPEPLAMTNSTGATVYYLFFASSNETGARIADDLFRKRRGAKPA